MKRDLSEHMFIHTGDTPHRCETCGKSLNQEENLTKHMLVHNGSKPYEPRYEKTGFLHMRKQRRRSASR